MLLFVYGTMLSRGRNFNRLYECNAIRIGEIFETLDRFDLYMGSKNGAPCAVRNDNGWPLLGELYAVPDQYVETIIDACEGHPTLYERQPVGVRGFDLTGLTIYTYVYVREVDREDAQVGQHLGYLVYEV
jgi:gamma-glutamylcyclotransferase (GGCT)/AIG2-like uncharacterized protein YtfP